MKSRPMLAVIAVVVVLSASPLYPLNLPAGTTSHACAVQNDTSLTFTFTIPLGKSITNVRMRFGFAAGDSVPAAFSGLTVRINNSAQCQDCPCTFTQYWDGSSVSTELRVNSGDDANDYYARLTSPSTNVYQIEAVPYDLNTSPWSGTGTVTWSVTLSLSSSVSYHFSLLSILATPDPSSVDLAFATIDNCNAAPVATIAPPAGSNYFVNRGIVVKGSATDPDTPLTYQWNLDAGAFTGTGGSLTSADPGKPVYFTANGAHQLGLTATDSKGAASVKATKDLILYDPSVPADIALLQAPLTLDIPKKTVNPPTIDGAIAGDAGWNYARQIQYQTGGTPDLTMQYIVLDNGTDKDLYLSFEVTDNSTAKDDCIILGFRPNQTLDADLTKDRVLIFKTSDDSLTALGNSSGWTKTGYSIANAGKKSTYLSVKWVAELKIPLKIASGGSQWIDVPDNFLFYFNVYRVQTAATDQLSWPRFAPPPTSTGLPLNPVTTTSDTAPHAYSPAEWGNATISTTASAGGIYLNWNDLGTKNPSPADTNPTHIMFNFENIFFADVRNSTTISGTAVDATGVQAQFRVAQWGIGSTPIVIAPGLGPATIPASSYYEFTTTWTPTDEAYRDHCHQCIWVDLTAPVNVHITTPTVQRNMDFVDSVTHDLLCPPPPPPAPDAPPPGDGNATVSVEGQGDPPEGAEEQEVVVEVNKEEYVREAGTGDDLPKLPPWLRNIVARQRIPTVLPLAQGTRSYIRWEASGQLFTGKYVTVDGKQVKLYRPIGTFGYVVEHRGEVAGWQESITGEKVQKIGPRSYRIMLSKEGRTPIAVEIKPVVVHGWLASIHGGLSVPLGGLAPSSSIGGAFVLDAGYQLTPHLALVLEGGINYFFPLSSGGSASWAINVSPDIRYLLVPRGSLRPFAGVGPSLLYSSAHGLGVGANACVGLDYRLAPRLDLELGAMYHYVLPSNAQLLQVLLGVLYRF